MAQGYYGTESSPLANLYSERVVLTPHTSDPSGTVEGDYWLRTDLNSGDKIATIRLQNADGIQDVPVFPDSATVSNGVVKVRRLFVPGEGVGFIPILDQGPAFVEVGFQHDGTRYGWHDSLSGVPPAESWQTNRWPTIAGSGTTLEDDVGSIDGTINGATWTAGDGVGGFYLDYDGTDDETTLPGSASAWTHFTNAGEGSFGCWLNPDAVDDFYTFFGSTLTGSEVGVYARIEDDGTWFVIFLYGDGTSVFAGGGSPTANTWQPFAFTADGSTLRIRTGTNMSQVASATIDQSTASDWDNNAVFGRRGPNDTSDWFDGGIDIPWVSDREVTQSELQSWVSKTEVFYS